MGCGRVESGVGVGVRKQEGAGGDDGGVGWG